MKTKRRVLSRYLCVFLGFVTTQSYLTGIVFASEISQERLSEITKLMHQQVQANKIAGTVALVSQHGKILYLETAGRQDIEKDIAMNTNTIFRIASMTKPITSTAIMVLYDRGLLNLDDPVSTFIPEFKDQTVIVSRTDRTKTRPAKREMTVKHLLTHTSGLTYQWDGAIGPLYKEAGITHGLLEDDSTLEEKMKRLGRIPLLHDPGDGWTYGLSIDVLGRIVEVVSGSSLKDFLQENIFKPLRMNDTFFFVPDDKRSRLATAYAPKPDGGIRPLANEIIVEGTFEYTAAHPLSASGKYFSGGGGLCSTISDYHRFASMLLNKGQLDGKRILKESTVELMRQDQVGDLRKGEGFGLGISVVRNGQEPRGLDCAGSFGWGGFWYTTFFVDPGHELIGICMGQLHPDGGAVLNGMFKGLVYNAIEKSTTSVTVEHFMSALLSKARAGEYSYIIDHMISDELRADLIRKYGESNWREKYEKDKLSSLPYYFGWLKKPEIRFDSDKVYVSGEHGCYAVFKKNSGGYFICDFGQKITSM